MQQTMHLKTPKLFYETGLQTWLLMARKESELDSKLNQSHFFKGSDSTLPRIQLSPTRLVYEFQVGTPTRRYLVSIGWV